MNIYMFSLCLTGAALWDQAPPPPAPAAAPITLETVVATADGKKITAGDLQKFVTALPPEMQQSFVTDRKEFLRQFLMLKQIVAMAEKEKLDQISPYKEQVEYARAMVLWQAFAQYQVDNAPVTLEEQKHFYDANKDNFSQAKVKVIYLPFSALPPANPDPKAPKLLSESDARKLAEEAVAEARKGTSFVELVKQYSRDANSIAKGGDFGMLKKSENIPQPIKSAIFALKPGEVTNPLRQPNGYYVFRLEEMVVPQLEQIRGVVIEQVRQGKLQQLFEKMRGGIDIKIENEAYFAKPQTPQQPPVAQKKQ